MTESRSGFVALVGRPNVGKSTLVNRLAGAKLAIVSPRPQTTRTRIQAIVNRQGAQVILIDTPGITSGRDALRNVMRRIAHGAAADADLALVLVEADGELGEISREDRRVIDAARAGPGRVIVAINKIDRLQRKEALLPWIERYARQERIEAVVPIAALHGDGTELLLDEIVARLPEGPPLFAPDLLTDQAERVLCAELVREQILARLQQEVPHSAAVLIDSFEDGRDDDQEGLCRLEGRIVVERESQKGIVVGRGGRQVKAISTAARAAIEALLGCKVFLRLRVTVDKDWRQNARAVARLGYGWPRE